MSQIPQEELESKTDSTEETNDIETAAEEGAMNQPRLIVKRSGQETEDVFILNPPSVIGRFDASVGPVDIDLGTLPEASYVSRKHAKITMDEGVWTLTDLGSSNGTFVLREDFERVDETELEDGTEFALGNARFIFRIA